MEIEKYIVPSVLPEMVSDSHRYKLGDYEISLLYPCEATRELFEIMYGEDSIERFNTLAEAEERIYALLDEVRLKLKLRNFLQE